MTNFRELWRNGLWENNVVLAQCLALCPLLAVTSSATNGLGLGLATLFVMIGANILSALLNPIISRSVRIPVNILMIATLVTITDLVLNAYLHSLHKVLGLFIPLIVTNCAILGRVEAFASKNRLLPATIDALAMGFGFLWVLVVLGGIREIIGSGTLFADADLLLGSAFSFMEMTIIPEYRGYLLIILPPGGFLVLGAILAAQKAWQNRQALASKALGGESCA